MHFTLASRSLIHVHINAANDILNAADQSYLWVEQWWEKSQASLKSSISSLKQEIVVVASVIFELHTCDRSSFL